MGKTLGLLGAAIAPPAAAFAFLQAWAKAHPVLALIAFVAYEAVVLGLSFAGKLVGGTADELNRRWKDDLARTIDEGTRRRLSGFERRYREAVLGNLRFIDLKGLATMGFYTPELDEVFVDISLVHSDPAKVPSDVLGHHQVHPERRFIGDLIDQPKPVVLAVIGAPGCGKTTLLRHTALLVCRKRRRRRGIPVLLYLRDHVQAIAEDTALTDLVDRAAPAGWFEQKLRAGSCVVLLDGLDEVADHQNRRTVSDWVERQIARHPSNDFVITSRPHGYESAPVSGADVVQVRGFTDEQVTRFVRSWYFAFEQRSTGEKSPEIARRAEGEANDLLERLHQNPSLYELSVNPLLLTMIANVHKFRGALPGSRVDLYSEICQVLLWRRQEAKRLRSELSGEQKMTLMSGLAFSMMSREVRDVSRDEIAVEFRSSLRRMAGGLDENAFLADMTSCGLLLERERDTFAFAHLTFQEFLAAHHIREKQLTKVLVDNVNNLWWRETTLLHVARASADAIVRAVFEFGSVWTLSLAFDIAEQGSELAPELRKRLDDLLDTPYDSDAEPSLRTLITRVLVARHLRKLVRTGAGTHICAEPVPVRVYKLFLAQESPGMPDVPLGGPDEPARGMWHRDVVGFVDWVNRIAAAEQIFRLAVADELMSSPLAAKLEVLSPHTAEAEERAHFSVTMQEVREDLHADLVLLPEIMELGYVFRIAPDLHWSPAKSKLLRIEIRHMRALKPEGLFGRALCRAAMAANPKRTNFTEQFSRTFVDMFESKGNPRLDADFPKALRHVQECPTTRWGQARLPDLVVRAAALFSRREPVTAEEAASVRLLATCLAHETDKANWPHFRSLAASASILQRRADGRIPANETIVLATD
ncbi:NACHT domain-containing protein [Lentzea cavernae]|uniref:NACHT domain-containing protein n=1 Tax=Lentzea cavernae TaxID=2020703 RepID=A0ABQ3MSR7_9PSEU|nr:NACHT domain-containing protein [Lentzea cavernae]GHH60920.1 hypothetical protein GCM10017774_86120 [Lentzea cavernae]